MPSGADTEPRLSTDSSIHVLHVLHAWEDGAPRSSLRRASADRCDAAIIACAAALRTLPEVRHRVVVLGGTSAAKRVRALGIDSFVRIAPPVQRPSLAARTFALQLETFGPFDAVHLWGNNLLALHPWHEKVKRVVATDLQSGRTRIVGEWEEPGHANGAGEALAVPSLCPARCAELQGLRSRWREKVGLGGDDLAVALLADPPDEGEIARFTFMATLLRVSGLSTIAVLNPSGREGERGLTPWRVEMLGAQPISTTRPLAAALPMCDLAIFAPGSRFATTPMQASWRDQCLARVALDLGIPIVTASRDVLPVDLDDLAVKSMLAHSPHPAGFARVIRRLAETRVPVTPPPSTDAAFAAELDRLWRA